MSKLLAILAVAALCAYVVVADRDPLVELLKKQGKSPSEIKWALKQLRPNGKPAVPREALEAHNRQVRAALEQIDALPDTPTEPKNSLVDKVKSFFHL
ncbi:hypothetical protein AAVH_34188 [Aphelenchoides avenae]|nr:hypothetical protein AAVH_34188 [Aphelenchus avenae]